MNSLFKNNKWFLGGPCGKTTWRENVIPVLEQNGIDFFNPQKKEGGWSEEARAIERKEKEECEIFLALITPDGVGSTFSYFEIADMAHKVKDMQKAGIVFLAMGEFDKHMQKVLTEMFESVKQIVGDERAIIGFIVDFNEIF